MTRRTAFQFTSALALAFARAGREAQAQSRVARLLVGFGPGSGIDAAARALASEMTDYASPLLVENKPGAAERVAIDALLSAPADGNTLLFTGSSPLAVLPHVYRKLAYDPLHDLVPVSPVCTFPFALTVGPLVPSSVHSLSEFAAWCRANPALASYGTVGAGTPHHFIGYMLAQAGDFQFTHVPYQGLAAVNDMVAGRLAATVLAIGTTLPYVKTGQARVLAVSGPHRSALLPDVPTMAEAGYPSVQVQDWFGIFASARTPPAIVAAIHKSAQRAVASDAVRTTLAQLSFEPFLGSTAEFAQRLSNDYARWAPVIQASGFRIED
jgi:tripartite-type tricarboxylate transporter receptor subunit TctC